MNPQDTGNTNLLDTSQSTQDVLVATNEQVEKAATEFMEENQELMEDLAKGPENQVLTEVTSVAQEEAKTGEKVKLPSAEEMVQRATVSFLRNKQLLNLYFKQLSSKQKVRVMNAIIDIPTDKIPVCLKEDEEKTCFALGQKCLMDRFLLTQHSINQQVQADRQKKAEEAKSKDQLAKDFISTLNTDRNDNILKGEWNE